MNMKKYFSAGFLFLCMITAAETARAQNTVMYDGGEEIVQLNNLRIQSISNTGTSATITASRDTGYSCYQYGSEYSSVSSPCPLYAYPSQTYTIEVNNQTILLQRNRARMSIGQFQVGDRINVYGFLSGYSGTMEALITRNLDYPRRETWTQLNNLEVITAPGSQVPTTLTAQVSYYPYTRYSIEISAATQILDVNRNSLALSQIRTGDRINVYGALASNGTTMRATILRDLSRSWSSNTLRITTDSNLRATTGVWYEAAFKVSGGHPPYTIESVGSDTVPGLSFTQSPYCAPGQYCTMMISPDTLYLRGTPTTPGTYRITIRATDSGGPYLCVDYAPGYGPGYCGPQNPQSGTQTFTLVVSGGTPGGTGAPVIESLNGPSYLSVGQNGTWTIRARDPEAGQLTYSVRWGDENVYYYGSAANSQIVMPPQTSTSATFGHSYAYRGTYTAVFTVTDSQGLSTSSTISVNVQ